MAKSTQLTVLRTGLSYDKIIKDVDRRELRTGSVEQNWNNYIEIARSMLAVAEVARMGVAEVATRATLIRCGGDRHSHNWKTVQSKLTVKAFANSIGVKPATLWLWIKIKQKVFDQLPAKDRAKFKHDAAEKTFKLIGSKGKASTEAVNKIYSTLSGRTPQQRAADRAILQAMSLLKTFRHRHELLTNSQVSAIRVALLEMLKIIEERK